LVARDTILHSPMVSSFFLARRPLVQARRVSAAIQR
jgi:hypothetical protein